jgi:hypothetical protein
MLSCSTPTIRVNLQPTRPALEELPSERNQP